MHKDEMSKNGNTSLKSRFQKGKEEFQSAWLNDTQYTTHRSKRWIDGDGIYRMSTKVELVAVNCEVLHSEGVTLCTDDKQNILFCKGAFWNELPKE